MEAEMVLDILGSETRRRILRLLSIRRKCYLTEISKMLEISQKALIRHLEILEKRGIISSYYEKEEGPARKYFFLNRGLQLDLRIAPGSYVVLTREVVESPKSELELELIECRRLDPEERMKKLTSLRKKLEEKLEEINRERDSILDLLSKIDREMRDAEREEIMKKLGELGIERKSIVFRRID